jgi:hypothetical protein
MICETALITLYSSKITYTNTNTSFIIPIESSKSQIFTNNSYGMDTNALKESIRNLSELIDK